MPFAVLTDEPDNETVWKALPLINQQLAAQEAEAAEAAAAPEEKEEDDDDEAAEGEGDDDDDDSDDSDEDDDDDDDEEEVSGDEDAAAKEKAAKAFSDNVEKMAIATQTLEEANQFDGMPVFSEKDRLLRDQVRSVVESLVEDDPSTQVRRPPPREALPHDPSFPLEIHSLSAASL